jgi:hypothetical protein
MVVLLVEGWAHPTATNVARASRVVVRAGIVVVVVLMVTRLGRGTFSLQ